jgi:IS30 family transposase
MREVTFMALTANALAKKLGCAWKTIQRAIQRGELKAVWDEARREWRIEEGRELAFFRARLDYLRHLRCERAERMKWLWKVGRLCPRRRKQVPTVVVERLKRPSWLAIGQGIGTRTAPIVWRSAQEGESHCPACGMALKVLWR